MKHDNYLNKKHSRKLRTKQTPGEILLWSKLRNRQFLNFKFRRQHRINNYIVDFFSHEMNLVIEIDGASHDDSNYTYDKLREDSIISLVFIVFRFTEYEVMNDLDSVLQTLENIANSPSP